MRADSVEEILDFRALAFAALRGREFARGALKSMERRLLALSLKGDADAAVEATSLQRLLAESDDRAIATPRTVVVARQRKEADVIHGMARRGQLPPEEERAALMIRELMEAWHKALGARCSNYDGAGLHNVPGGDELLPDWASREQRLVFAPWQHQNSLIRVHPAIPPTRLNRAVLALSIVLDNASLRGLERFHGLRHGSLTRHLREALADYGKRSLALRHSSQQACPGTPIARL